MRRKLRQMGNRIFSKSGFTLAELALSMTILSILVIGSATMNGNAIKIGTEAIQSSEYQNSLNVIFRMIEKDMIAAAEVRIYEMPNPLLSGPITHKYRWQITPVTGGPMIEYNIDLRDPTTSIIERTEDSVTQRLMSPGHLTVGPSKYPASPFNQLALWFTNSDKMMTVNLGAQYHAVNGALVEVSGYSRSFYIRIGTTKDCRVSC